MGLSVMSIQEWIISHILFLGGLIVITIGLLNDSMGFTIAGIWAFVLGVCLGTSAIVKKLFAK